MPNQDTGYSNFQLKSHWWFAEGLVKLLDDDGLENECFP